VEIRSNHHETKDYGKKFMVTNDPTPVMVLLGCAIAMLSAKYCVATFTLPLDPSPRLGRGTLKAMFG